VHQRHEISRLQNGRLSDGRRLVAGFSAGITEALIIVTPFEVVKIRLQQQKGMARELLKYRVRLPILQPSEFAASLLGISVMPIPSLSLRGEQHRESRTKSRS
jgi:hypothetical protein